MATPELQEFFEVLQSGDQSAVEELLRQFDPFLRRAIRLVRPLLSRLQYRGSQILRTRGASLTVAGKDIRERCLYA